MAVARYDRVADFYEAGWPDDPGDPLLVCLLDLLGDVQGQRVLDVACGHGRVTRELARRGAVPTGIDISGELLRRATADDDRAITFIQGDVSTWRPEGVTFDHAVCGFGLSDIDDLAGAVASVSAVLPVGGRFVFSIVHPCFAGGTGVASSWPVGATYYDEGWWAAEDSRSTLRQRVGANHRMLSTYVNTLRTYTFIVDAIVEPPPAPDWAIDRPDAARSPLYLVVRTVKSA